MKFSKIINLNKDNYVVAANKMYIVGNQDGTFSPLGFHVDGKMSGIFTQPLRISNGYTLKENDVEVKAKEYSFENGNSIFTYETFTKKISAFDNDRAILIEFNTNETQSLKMNLNLELDGCWTKESSDYQDGETKIVYQDHESKIATQESNGYYAGVFVVNGNIEEDIIIENNTKVFVIASLISLEDLKENATRILENHEKLLENQHARRSTLISHSKLEVKGNNSDDEEMLVKLFDSLKLNYDMLVQNINKIGEGYTAGYPDFQWFFGCDTTYGIHGTLAVGQFEMTKQTLRLLKNISLKHNGNGRIVHEVSPFGFIYGDGNLQETPHFISAVYETYMWTGDEEFLDEMLDFCIEGMKWVETNVESGAYCPKGNGIVEVHGIEGRVIDIAMLTIDAYSHLEKLCSLKNREELVNEYKAKRELLEDEVINKFYCKEQKYFGDILCTIDEIKASKDLLVNSIKNTKTLTKDMDTYLTNVIKKNENNPGLIPLVLKNWVSVIPYTAEFIPTSLKEDGLRQMETNEFHNEYGMKLGCMSDDSSDEVHDIYTLNKSMSINTGYLAEVFARNNQVDKGYELLLKLNKSAEFGMCGAISEILPDDGCFMQFWSGYGIHHVLIRYIFGIYPDAPNKTLIINPSLPTSLNYFKISDLRLNECLYSIEYERIDGKIKVNVEKSHDDYKVKIGTV